VVAAPPPPRPRPAAPPQPVTRATSAGAGATRTRPAASASLLERAKTLRDLIEQSKLTAANPWSYTIKAREWTRRAQAIVDEVARGSDGAAMTQRLEAVRAEVDGDADFQEARRRA
jgi:hypothetical protein